MIARPRSFVLMLSAALLFAGAPPTVAAAQDNGSWQLRRGTQVDCGPVHLFMLPWLTASDKATATRAGKDLRDMLRAKFDSKEWCLIDSKITDAHLKASNFPTEAPLANMDAMLLANPVRADVFLQAEVQGFEYSGMIYYVGDDHAWLRERVPKQDAASNGTQAATFFTARVKEVHVQPGAAVASKDLLFVLEPMPEPVVERRR